MAGCPRNGTAAVAYDTSPLPRLWEDKVLARHRETRIPHSIRSKVIQ